MHHTIFFGLIALNFGTSSGSSSDGVGKTLNGVLAELFLGVLECPFDGVSTTIIAAADFLFLGDDRAASS
jgi:hypothetical protein